MGKARLYMRQCCQGVHENKSCFEMKTKKTLELDPHKHSKELRYPAHDDEQHQQAAALQRQNQQQESNTEQRNTCLLYTSPSPRDKRQSRMPSSA